VTAQLLSYDDAVRRYEPALGLETHVELGTETKLFCGCSTQFGGEPNTQVCPVCLGLPGSLPVTNERAIEFTVKIGLALHCSIASWCRFARKNYFYPDMPKNYQVSQYDEPLCVDGYLDVDVAGTTHRVGIERVHLEEDTGKTLHVGGATGRIHGATHSLVDYNRAGIPLVEIVTRPVTGTGADVAAVAKAYVTELRELLRGLGVSDVRMEQGSLRCDVNVSLAPAGAPLGTRTETKNVNSLRSVERAVRHEVERQGALLDTGVRIVQETRHFHEDSGTTSPGRSKEEAQDYRYFPEPDLVPLAPAAEWVEQLRASLPEPPTVARRRFAEVNGFTPLDLEQMTNAGVLDLVAATITPIAVARISALEDDGTLTNKLARQVAEAVLAGEGEPDAVIEAHGWKVAGEDELAQAVDAAIAANPAAAEKVRSGNQGALGPMVGAVMKTTAGSGDARRARELLLERLTS
jgi:aspartyl-tRNA(Asn)/glutamyl-tRNA(Gln) amidotransferase subunit B